MTTKTTEGIAGYIDLATGKFISAAEAAQRLRAAIKSRLTAAESALEKQRKALKQPFIDAGKAIDAAKTYKVAGWAPVAEGATGEPIWDVMETYLKNEKTIKPRKLNMPTLKNVSGNPGMV